MSDLLSTLQMWAGGREGCLQSAAAKVDAVAVCHEVRSIATSPSEALSVTFRVLNRREPPGGSPDRSVGLGEQLHLKSLQLDSVVLVSVWATESAGGGEPAERTPARRACGELRIPVRYVVTKCDGSVYHTWITLDSPGLNDSVASIGLLDSEQDSGEAFAQALSNAPRQLSQPKACVSLCKVSSLDPSGQVAWTADVPRQERISRWGPLLRSQQQHAVMCTAQHLQGVQVQRERRLSAGATQQKAGQLADLARRAEEQALELQVLREQARSRQAKFQPPERRRGEGGTDGEVQEQHELELAARLDAELAELRDELSKVGEEANGKIDSANARIRTLRQERDDAVRDVERENRSLRDLRSAVASAVAEKATLEEQKAALTKIVEDLHEACTGAGIELTPAARHSIDSLRSLRVAFP